LLLNFFARSDSKPLLKELEKLSEFNLSRAATEQVVKRSVYSLDFVRERRSESQIFINLIIIFFNNLSSFLGSIDDLILFTEVRKF